MFQAEKETVDPAKFAKKGQWSLISDKGKSVLSFNSMLSVTVSSGGKVLSNNIEEGAFRSYSKVADPMQITISVGVGGTADSQQGVLTALEKMKKEASLVFLNTPSAFYHNLTLQTYSYSRTVESGTSLLVVTLTLVEVGLPERKKTANELLMEKCKNATSSRKIKIGKIQVKVPTKQIQKLLEKVIKK